MSESKTEHRASILAALAEREHGSVRAASIDDLRTELTPGASITQFKAALGSLAYKPGARHINWRRIWSSDDPWPVRTHVVSLR